MGSGANLSGRGAEGAGARGRRTSLHAPLVVDHRSLPSGISRREGHPAAGRELTGPGRPTRRGIFDRESRGSRIDKPCRTRMVLWTDLRSRATGGRVLLRDILSWRDTGVARYENG